MPQFHLIKHGDKVACDYLDIRDCDVSGGQGWYAGSNSVDRSNNSGWRFMDVPPEVPGIVGIPVETGVYTLGNYSLNYPLVLDFTYPLSERLDDDFVLSGVEIGAISVSGNKFFVSWHNETTDKYGVDIFDIDNKLDGAYFITTLQTFIRSMMTNFTQFIVAYCNIPTGCSIEVEYSTDYGVTFIPLSMVDDVDRMLLSADNVIESTTILLKVICRTIDNTAPSIESAKIILA